MCGLREAQLARKPRRSQHLLEDLTCCKTVFAQFHLQVRSMVVLLFVILLCSKNETSSCHAEQLLPRGSLTPGAFRGFDHIGGNTRRNRKMERAAIPSVPEAKLNFSSHAPGADLSINKALELRRAALRDHVPKVHSTMNCLSSTIPRERLHKDTLVTLSARARIHFTSHLSHR